MLVPQGEDEPASPLRDVSQDEACPTDFGFGADQDRANIAKTSTVPHDLAPRVTSSAADEGRRNLDEGEAAAERVSNDTEEIATVLTSMDATTVLASEVAEVPTSSGSIPTAGPPAAEVPTGSDVVPTAGLIFATAILVTPYTRRKGKKTIVESETLKKKKVQEQIDAQVARELEEQMTREDQRKSEQGEGSGTPTESHHTPTYEASQSSHHELSSPSLPPVPTESLPTVIPSENPPLRQYTRRARIAQSSALLPVVDEPASPIRDDSQGEACPTDSGLAADQDRVNIAKPSTLPSDSTPRVTSLAAVEGNMQQKLDELTALCTSLQRQQSKMVSKFEAHELENNSLKARIKLLEDKDEGVAEQSGDDAPIKGKRLDEGEEVAERFSDDTEEMETVLTSMDATSILTSGGV
nr:hypothetical protein [Tanacetum cinerariifolium]